MMDFLFDSEMIQNGFINNSHEQKGNNNNHNSKNVSSTLPTTGASSGKSALVTATKSPVLATKSSIPGNVAIKSDPDFTTTIKKEIIKDENYDPNQSMV